ncbi:hypothetical protein GOODEAATRI_028898 [Goodea atripinnis]|uniref:Uncharacterized protein n=1 Tax=Goodea atripinnis TaxID=208336 RepID=A0ABV0PI08_9TELE
MVLNDLSSGSLLCCTLLHFGKANTRLSTSIIAKIAGPGRKRQTSDPDPSSGSDSGDGRPVSAKCLKMASSGGNGVAGSETLGRRSGTQQRRGSGSEQTASTSKKKQKDKVNQESREAKRAAAAAANAAVDGVLAEVKKGKMK